MTPLLGGVVDGLVARVVVSDTDVGPEVVGVDRFSLIPHGALNEGVEGIALHVGDALNADAAPALDGTGHPVLVVAPVLARALAADHRLVHFDHADQRGSAERVVAHRFADAVAQIPGSLVGDVQLPLELIGADALTGIAHEVDGDEPLAERQVGVVHDRARGHAELVAAAPALPLAPALEFIDCHVAAAHARHAMRPADGLQQLSALLVRSKPVKQRNEVNVLHGSDS